MPRVKIDQAKLLDAMHHTQVRGDGARILAHAGGRPTAFSVDLWNCICYHVSKGLSMRSACKAAHNDGFQLVDEGSPRYWLDTMPEVFPQYHKALQLRYAKWADELADIADDGTNDWVEVELKDGSTKVVLDREHVSRSELRISTRKWLLSKLVRPIYGDSQTVDVNATTKSASVNVNLNVTDPIEAAKVYQRLMQGDD